MKRYLETLESADQEMVIEPSKVAEALKKLQEHREPEAHFMRATSGPKVPAHNVQAAVDSEHALIVDQQVATEATDNRCLLPMGRSRAGGGEWSGTSVARGTLPLGSPLLHALERLVMPVAGYHPLCSHCAARLQRTSSTDFGSACVVSRCGLFNGEQAEACEVKGILPHVPANRGVNNQGGGKCLTAAHSSISRSRTGFSVPPDRR